MDQKKDKIITYIDKFLGKYSQIQLWTFIILMSLAAILYIINPQAHIYKIVAPDQEQAQQFVKQYLETNNISEEKTGKIREISAKEAEQIEKKYMRKANIAAACIIGITLSQKKKRKNIKKILKKIQSLTMEGKKNGN